MTASTARRDVTASILLVEDEPGLVRTLGDRLTAEGYAVTAAGDGDAAYDRAASGAFDLLVVDVMLPRRSGVDVVRDLRRAGIATPALMLTARDATEDIVVALKLGADDYLTKPFRTAELLARIEALLRRARGEAAVPERRITIGDLELDLETARVRRGGAEVALSEREFDLLAYLAAHRGRPVSREELLREVWRYQPGTVSRTVDQHIAQVRRKLDGGRRRAPIIVTVQHQGYLLRARA